MKKKAKVFDFEVFSREAIKYFKAGDSMIGTNGIFTPLRKRLIEDAMEGEIDAHMEATRKERNELWMYGNPKGALVCRATVNAPLPFPEYRP